MNADFQVSCDTAIVAPIQDPAKSVRRILVIDDDREMVDLLAQSLAQEGFDLSTAQSGDGGIELGRKTTPDLILLDNWLTDWKSDANGQQLSKELKTNPATSHIPIIIISAVSNIKEIAEAGQADDYLRKPFDLTELIGIVNKHIKQ